MQSPWKFSRIKVRGLGQGLVNWSSRTRTFVEDNNSGSCWREDCSRRSGERGRKLIFCEQITCKVTNNILVTFCLTLSQKLAWTRKFRTSVSSCYCIWPANLLWVVIQEIMAVTDITCPRCYVWLCDVMSTSILDLYSAILRKASLLRWVH